MIGRLLFLALWLALGQQPAAAIPLVAISNDEVDDETGTNAADSLLFDEVSSTDTAISLSTTTVHDATNGGPPGSTSKRSIRVNVASGEHAAYDLKPGILKPNLTEGSFSLAVHIPASGDVTVAKPIGCLTEASQTDYGCCVVQEPGRLFSLAYLGSDETPSFGTCTVDGDCNTGGTTDEKCYGTKCRKVWATTTVAALGKRCSNAVDVPCTTAGDCPAGATCDGAFMPVLEVAQENASTSSVRCEMRRAGVEISTGITKATAGVSGDATVIDAINSHATPSLRGGLRIGFINSGSLSSAGTMFLDSVVVDSSMRAGANYVAGLKPSSMLDCASVGTCRKSWVENTCRTGGLEACVNDWNVSPYLFDAIAGAPSAENSAKATGTNREGDFPQFGPQGWALRSKETVKAIDLYAFGRRPSSGATDFRIKMGTLSCPESTTTPGTGAAGCEFTPKQVCSEDATKVCGSGADCSGTCGDEIIQLPAPGTTHEYLTHHLTTASPSDGESSWQDEFLSVGARVSSATSGASRTIFLGALQANVAVRKPDASTPITGTDRNGDGKYVQAFVGASTLYGTSELFCQGGLAAGQACSRDFYCAFDSVTKDIGCEGAGDTSCIVCQGEHGTGCSNAGVPDDALCDFGTCVSTKCTGDPERTCAGDGDCQKGPCLTGDDAACVDSCPTDPVTGGEGVCPTALAGWATPVVEQVTADVIMICAVPGETSGQGYANRFDKIMRGRMIGVPDNEIIGSGFPGADGQTNCSPGTTASCCITEGAVGTGVCECTDATVVADCGGGAGRDCINEVNGVGVCGGDSDPTRLACSRGGHCNQTVGHGCKAPAPDEIGIGQGLNDTVLMFSETSGQWYKGTDTECATRSSAVSAGVGLGTFGSRPVLWCPDVGSGAYKVPATPCNLDSTCSGSVAPDSQCFGICTGATPSYCTSTGECQDQVRCTVNAIDCDVDSQCNDGQTCVGGRPDLPGITHEGRCSCTADAQCPDDYLCVGPVSGGPKFCRPRCGCSSGPDCGAICVTNPDCGTGGTCTAGRCTAGPKSGVCAGNVCTSGPMYCGATAACETAFCDTAGQCDGTGVLHGFCQGRCTATCSAIDCASAGDADCGGTVIDQRWGGMRSLTLRGKCNPATNTCTCCGASVCGDHASLLTRGCSCNDSADCGGGTCTNGECQTGAQSDCLTDRACAPGQRCLRCTEQLRAYQASHYGLLPEVMLRAAAKIQAELNFGPCADGMCQKLGSRSCSTDDACDDRPGLVASAVPMPGGRTPFFTYPDIACWQHLGSATWVDRAHYASTYHNLFAVLPAHRVALPTEYNRRRMKEVLNVDHAHTTGTGARLAGQPFADIYNAADVCLDGAGVPVRYCQKGDNSFGMHCTCTVGTQVADCGTGGICSLLGICIKGTTVACTLDNQCNQGGGRVCTAETFCTDAATGCATGESCNRRKCLQSESNCPGAATVCGPD